MDSRILQNNVHNTFIFQYFQKNTRTVEMGHSVLRPGDVSTLFSTVFAISSVTADRRGWCQLLALRLVAIA